MIVEKGASIAHRNTLGITALHEAAFKVRHRCSASCLTPPQGAIDSVTFLISRGADINCRTNDNETALHYAVRARDPVMVKLLLHRVCAISPERSVRETHTYGVSIGGEHRLRRGDERDSVRPGAGDEGEGRGAHA